MFQCELKLTIHNNYNCVSFPAKQTAEKLIENGPLRYRQNR